MCTAKGLLALSPSQRSLGINQDTAYVKCTAAGPSGTATSASFPDVMPSGVAELGPAPKDGAEGCEGRNCLRLKAGKQDE